MIFKKFLQRWQKQPKYDGPEKREFARLVYPPSQRPTLKISEHHLEVVDISERGLKVLNPMQIAIGKKISGTLMLLSGKSMDFAGKIVWQAEGSFGVLTTPIPEPTIIEELRALLRTIGACEST